VAAWRERESARVCERILPCKKGVFVRSGSLLALSIGYEALYEL